MKKQSGVSMGGFLLVLVVLFFAALLGFKLFTPYSQYLTIKKHFKTLANTPEVRAGTRKDAVIAYQRYAMIDSVDSVVGPEDIEVTKDGGEVVISASYAVKVPMFGNISLLLDFNPTSAAK